MQSRIRQWLLGSIDLKINALTREVWNMGAAIDLLRAEVEQLTTVVDSAVVLIQGFADRIKDAATLEEVQAVVAEIEAGKMALASAVESNT